MANTYTLIDSTTLSTTATSVTFSAIPATYDDLVLFMSVRGSAAGVASSIDVTFNSSTSNYSRTVVSGDGSTTESFRNSNSSAMVFSQALTQTGATSNTFSNNEIYIPKYTANANKPVSLTGATENNATEAYRNAIAGLWQNTSAISSITMSATFGSGSSFYLYGIKNT